MNSKVKTPDTGEDRKIKLAIVGSRRITDYQIMENFGFKALEMTKFRWSDVDRMVSGGAVGVDSFAENITEDMWLEKPIIHKPEWKKYGKKAGFMRNQLIVDDCDAAIVVWNGISRGTLDSIYNLQETDKPFILIEVTVIPEDKNKKPIYQTVRSIEFHGDWNELYERKIHSKRNRRKSLAT